MTAEVVVAIIAASVGVVTAALAFLGKRDEASAKNVEILVTGQSERISSLESRLDSLEGQLRSTRRELHQMQDHSSDLRKALERALEWIADAVEWMAGPREEDPPMPPDSESWRRLVDHPPKIED